MVVDDLVQGQYDQYQYVIGDGYDGSEYQCLFLYVVYVDVIVDYLVLWCEQVGVCDFFDFVFVVWFGLVVVDEVVVGVSCFDLVVVDLYVVVGVEVFYVFVDQVFVEWVYQQVVVGVVNVEVVGIVFGVYDFQCLQCGVFGGFFVEFVGIGQVVVVLEDVVVQFDLGFQCSFVGFGQVKVLYVGGDY